LLKTNTPAPSQVRIKRGERRDVFFPTTQST
jgi:hypothetical protein